MKAFNRLVGRQAEKIAADYLKQKGYAVVTKNFANRFGEIDIIAKDRETLVFVEVKAKIGKLFGSPEEMVGPAKLQKIRNMAQLFLNGRETVCRIDVVAIVLGENNEVVRLTHYENVC